MRPSRRHLLALMVAALLPSVAPAQSNWPSKPVRIVVPVPPGGGVDIYVRALAEQLGPVLGQTVIVDNKPGAAGVLAVKSMALENDGHTILYIHSGMVTAQVITGRMDMLAELKPVARLSHSPLVVAVKADAPYKTLGDLIKAVKAQPDKLSFGSGGVGSPPHLAVAQFDAAVGGFDVLHVPYKGAIQSATALAGGEVDFIVGIVGPVVPLVQAGKVRLLAVSSGKRLPLLPNVPTMAEASGTSFVAEPWGGLAIPAKGPDAAIKRLAEVLPKVMQIASVKEAATRMAVVEDYADAQEFRAQIAMSIEAEKPLVKKLDLKAE